MVDFKDRIIYKVDENGMLVPDLIIDDCYFKPDTINKYGDAWLKYTEDNFPTLHMCLFGSGELYDTALEVQERAMQRRNELREIYDRKYPRPQDALEIARWAYERDAAIEPVVMEEEVYVIAGINGDEIFEKNLRMCGEINDENYPQKNRRE